MAVPTHSASALNASPKPIAPPATGARSEFAVRRLYSRGMLPTFDSVIANFGVAAKEKLSNPATTGQPEDQLRAPFERLLSDLAALVGVFAVTPVGESSLSALKTRPDYAVTVGNALVGFVEMKAPGKGGDPRKFKDPHDKVQWDKLHSLPNLIYTDGNAFSLWQDGELVGSVIRLNGDIETSGASLKAPLGLLGLFDSFLRWQPLPPSSAKALAETTARLCRLLREEVTEQLELKSEVLTGLAEDWRKLLFPEASDERFADGYAQAVTFGMLMARTRGITLNTGLQQVANELSKTTTLIGAALKLLTDDASNQATLKTSLGTLTRVLDAVDWTKISKDFPEAWLYFWFFTDLSTAPEAAESARDRGQSELVAPWPTSVSAAASVHRACPARGEGRP